MKRTTPIKKASEVKTVVESLLDVSQACNEFQLTGTTRTHVLKKFKGVEHTSTEWGIIFRRERVTA